MAHNKRMAAFRVAPELLDAMRRVREKRGIPQSVQLDFALRRWLKSQGVSVKKSASRRALTRRKASTHVSRGKLPARVYRP